MRTPVRLALGMTATVVVGVLAATVASAYASPKAAAPIAAPGATVVDAAVLSPASVGGVSTVPSTDNPLLTPGVAGQVRAVQPDLTDTFAAIAAGQPIPEAPLPADVLAAAAAIDDGGGDSPETPAMIADAAAAATGSDTSSPDDPCAAPGADTAACPSGIESAIFADTYHEPLHMWVVPAAPASHAGSSVWCDGTGPGTNELWLDVATTVPATIHARYWPAANPADAHDLEIPGVPSEEAAWQAEIDATGTYTPNSYVFQHCAMMTGLVPNTDYVVTAYAIDTWARISAPEEATFSSAGQPTTPQMFAIPLGQSLLYVGVPYAAGQGEPTLMATRYATGSEPPACGSRSFTPNLVWALAPNSVDINADYLRSHHYMTSYGKRSVGILDVPEGTNIVVCALWFDSSAASFDRTTPTRYESLLASAPDTATPVFTIDSIRTVREIAQGSLTITGSTLFGNVCHSWNGPVPAAGALQTVSIGEVLCDKGGLWGGGSTNAFQVSTSYLKPDGNRVNSSTVIRMPSVLCTGPGCALPPDSTYDVGLPAVTVATGLCGSSFGADCTPPSTETSLGVATVSVHWERGASNGNTDWSVGSGVEVTPSTTPPDAPRFDVDRVWTAGLSADGLTGSASLSLRADRQVNYTITVSGDCWKGDPAAPITGRAATASGAYFTATASLSGLCPGASYSSTIELVDDAGHRTLASSTTPTVSIAPTAFQNWGGGFTVPQQHLRISAHVEVLHGYPWNEDWGIYGADLTVGDSRWPNTAHFDGTCFASDQNNIPATFEDQTVPLTDSIQLSTYSRFAVRGIYDGHEPSSRCGWNNVYDFEASASSTVTPAQLLRGVLIQTDFFQSGDRSRTARGHLYLWVTATRVAD